MKPSALLWLLASVFASACGTEIVIENRIPGANVENVRWIPKGGHVYDEESERRLEPGDSTNPIPIRGDDEGKSGRIHFELVVGGRVVALVTEAEFEAETGELTVFELRPATRATNPLVEDEN
jgi:hypothetical protein